MKKKLLLFSLFSLLLVPDLGAKNINLFFNVPDNNFGLLKEVSPIRKNILATLSPPSVVAGSTCGPGVVLLSATGAAGETIEWYTSQTDVTPVFTGNNYSPTLSTTTTFYVQSKSGSDTSTRVPVVGSVFTAPPAVTLTVSPLNSLSSPLCLGTSVTFTATGGADLFEFSVDGIVKQSMSSVRTYTTNSLTNGQVVSVRSRYAVTLDGSITETAWGTGALENNVLSASLSGPSLDGYVNSFSISPTEDKVVLGISGKAVNYRRIMIFLDTKPGGFNVSNYGDENGSLPPVRAFNYFNNNPSTFDSYFAADYCVAIATDGGEVNYYADVIELKTGNSFKTYLGTAATGVPTSVMGVNKNNSGITDYNLGFEIEVSKALIGYTTGDVKFFVFTMQDNAESNYNVTNSFLSPELTSSSSYGNGSIDYNFRDPNPVVVAGAAFTPCYSQDSITMSFASNPTPATVGLTQSKCTLISDPLGGNTPIIGTGLWTLKSGPGTVSFANNASGNTTATVSTPGTYVFTWTIKSGQCTSSSADISIVYNITNAPTGLATQNFCKINTPKVSDLVAVGNNVQWFLGATGGTALSAGTSLVTGSYYAEQTNATTLCKSITRLKVDVNIDNPAAPVVSSTQTFCNTAKVSNLLATGTDIKWYADATTVTPLLSTANLTTGTTYYASQTVVGNLSCESQNRNPTTVTINVTPTPTGSGSQIVCNSGTIASLVATGSGTLSWYANATGGSPLLSSTVLVSGTTYYASQTLSGCESATRYPLTVTVTNPQIPVSGGDQSVCATSPLQTLTATASVTTGTVVWYDAPTNGNLVTNPTLNSVGSVTYYAQNTIGLCTSTSRTAVVLGIKDSPFLKVVGKPCSLDLLTYTVNFTAASGSVISRSPAIGSIVGNSITGIPAGTAISISANKGNGCIETINITAPNCSCSPVDNAISGGAKSVCEGQSNPALTVSVNAGETVDWYSSNSGGIPLATNTNTYTPLNTAPAVYTYYAQARKVIDGCLSSSRTAVSLTITSQSAPTGSATQSFCESQNATVANLSATGTNIKWYSTLNSTSALSAATALTDGDYYATQTSTSGLLCESVNRLKVTVTINKPLAPTGSGSQIVCNSGTIASLVATGSGTLSWYANATGGSPLLSSTVLVSGTTYYASQTVSGCESATRYALTVTVTNPQIPVSGGDQSVCATSPLQTLTATASVTTGTVVWYSALTNGSSVANPTLNSVGSVTYYAQNTIGLCASTSRTAVVLEIKDSPFLNVVSSLCSMDLLTYTVNFTAASGSVISRSPAIGSIVGNSITGIPAGTAISISANKGNGCIETINITAPNCSCSPIDNAISGGAKSVCEGQSNPALTVSVNAGETVDWYSSNSGGSPLATNTNTYTPLNTAPAVYTYYAQARKVIDGCLSSSRTAVSLTITSQSAPTGSATQSFCESQNATVANLSATGTNVKWYSTLNSTSALSAATALTDGDYYATQTSTSGLLCESINRFKVSVTTDKPLPPIAGTITQPTCSNPTGTVVLNNLPNIGTWIIIPSVGNSVSGTGSSYEFKNLVASTTYTFKVTNGNGCTSVLSSIPVVINAIQALPTVPVASNVVQPTCAIPSGSITIQSQNGVTYSLDGINFTLSPLFTGLSASNYTLYVKNNLDTSCITSSTDKTNIKTVPLVPNVPSANIVQPTCSIQSGTVTITLQNGVEYSVDGINYQNSNVFAGLMPNNYTFYVRNLSDTSCVTNSSSATTINSIPNAPAIPTATSIQPTCLVQFGSIKIVAQNNSEYSIGGVFQDSPDFTNVLPGNYTLSVRFKNNTSCVALGQKEIIINSVPSPIQFIINGDCVAIPGTDLKEFKLSAVPLSNSYVPGNVSYEWKNDSGITIGTNSSDLNLSEIIKNSSETEKFPLIYSLTVTPLIADCVATDNISVKSVYCNVQKGISPDDNGSNDNFDLTNLNVRKLEIFNRYGLKVYSKTNYIDEWKGQTNNGDLLPSATYYYVIELGNGEETKTGWIYLIRDNQ